MQNSAVTRKFNLALCNSKNISGDDGCEQTIRYDLFIKLSFDEIRWNNGTMKVVCSINRLREIWKLATTGYFTRYYGKRNYMHQMPHLQSLTYWGEFRSQSCFYKMGTWSVLKMYWLACEDKSLLLPEYWIPIAGDKAFN